MPRRSAPAPISRRCWSRGRSFPFTLSPCGRGCARKASAGEGSVSADEALTEAFVFADRTPHPSRICRCAPPSPTRGEGKRSARLIMGPGFAGTTGEGVARVRGNIRFRFSNSLRDDAASHSRGALFARGLHRLPSLKRGGRRECRALAAPMAPVRKNARGGDHRFSRTHRHSLRNGLRLIPCSCVRKICQNVRTGGSDQPPVAGSEPDRAQRP